VAGQINKKVKRTKIKFFLFLEMIIGVRNKGSWSQKCLGGRSHPSKSKFVSSSPNHYIPFSERKSYTTVKFGPRKCIKFFCPSQSEFSRS
jgi:hypothetical protein